MPFKENLKWGIKEGEKIIIKPVYDTIFNFDSLGKVCLACYKAKGAPVNKFIKTATTIFTCSYLNKQADKLKIKTDGADTCSVFTLGKTTIKQYNDHANYFVVSAKNKKYLVNKNFIQPIAKGYYEIYVGTEPEFVITEIKNEANMVFTGLINLNEEEIIPYQYSHIKINSKDSLIICCSAGMGTGGDDDIFDYNGKKIKSYKRHVDMATTNFVIYKIYEPKEYYILMNIKTKEETNFNADELSPFQKDEVLLRVKNELFVFSLTTKKRKPYKK